MSALLMAFCPNQLDAFKGDHEQFVDRLVVASQKRHVEDASLQERVLVPFFEPSDSANTTFEPLERRATKSPFQQQQQHHGLKRNAGERSASNLASSPPKKENGAAAKARRGGKPVQGAPRRSGSTSDTESLSSASSQSSLSSMSASPARGARKHARNVDAQPAAASPLGPGRRSPSPPHKRGEHAPAADAASPGPRFAGPAFCNSPTPDSLPIPTMLMGGSASRLMMP